MARFGSLDTQYDDNSGAPLSGGKIYFYDSGSSNPKDTFSDLEQTTANANPYILDAAGRQATDIIFSGAARAVLRDANDVLIYELDPVGGADGTGGSVASGGQWEAWSGVLSYNKDDIVRGSDDLFYRSMAGSNLNNNPTSTSGFWMKTTLIHEYESTYTYSTGQIVESSDILYISLVDNNTGNTPASSPSEWKPITSEATLPISATDGQYAVYNSTTGAWVPVSVGRPYQYWKIADITQGDPGDDIIELTQLIVEDQGAEIQDQATLTSSYSPQFGATANLNDNDKFSSFASYVNPETNTLEFVFNFGNTPRNITALGQVPKDANEHLIGFTLYASDNGVDYTEVCTFADLALLPALNQSDKYYVIWDGDYPDPFTVKEAPQDSKEYVRKNKAWVESSMAGEGVTWNTTIQTTNFTAAAGTGYFTTGSITATLPAGVVGNVIAFRALANTLTVEPDGTDKIESTNPVDLVIGFDSTDTRIVKLLYTGSTYGWVNIGDGGQLSLIG